MALISSRYQRPRQLSTTRRASLAISDDEDMQMEMMYIRQRWKAHKQGRAKEQPKEPIADQGDRRLSGDISNGRRQRQQYEFVMKLAAARDLERVQNTVETDTHVSNSLETLNNKTDNRVVTVSDRKKDRRVSCTPLLCLTPVADEPKSAEKTRRPAKIAESTFHLQMPKATSLRRKTEQRTPAEQLADYLHTSTQRQRRSSGRTQKTDFLIHPSAKSQESLGPAAVKSPMTAKAVKDVYERRQTLANIQWKQPDGDRMVGCGNGFWRVSVVDSKKFNNTIRIFR